MDTEVLIQIVLFYVVLLISLTFHEAAHALVAKLGGDPTAYAGGQVSLNPIPHMRREPFGTVVLPLLMLVMTKGTWCMGYAHIPVDPYWADRHPKRAALMSAAGPAANFLLAALAYGGLQLVFRTDLISSIDHPGIWDATTRILGAFLLLNLVLGIFNLFPLPPLDGAGVLQGLFPKQLRPIYDTIRSQFFLMIIGMVLIWRAMHYLVWPVFDAIASTFPR